MSAADEVVCITWKYTEEQKNMPVLRYTNEVIGAYVTTGLRLKLYSYVDALKEIVIYCDTDSVIIRTEVWAASGFDCGDKFGDMTNELGPDEYIEEFGLEALRTSVQNRNRTDSGEEDRVQSTQNNAQFRCGSARQLLQYTGYDLGCRC